ncbi:hypothetical protein Agub_g10646, partial [Astrephomene gubernaculifera]
MAVQADVPGLLAKLAGVYLSNAGVPEHELPRRQAIALRTMSGILGSSMYARSSLEGGGDDIALVQALRKDLEAAGTDKSKMDKLPELCNRLSSGAGRPGLNPRLRTALLLLLRQLRGDSRLAGAGASGRIPASFSLTQSLQLGGLPSTYIPGPTPSLQQPQQHPQRPASGGPQQHHQHPHARPISATSYSGPVSGLIRPTSVVTPSEMGDDPALSAEFSRASLLAGLNEGGDYFLRSSIAPGSGGGAGAAAAASGGGGGGGGELLATGPPGGTLTATSESSLVRDVLYAAQGVSGRFVTFMSGAAAGGGGREVTSGFRLEGGVAAGVGPGRAMLVERLTELGWLFRRVREHISSSTGPGEASVRQALGAALASEVGDFYRLLALLEAQAGQPLPTPGDPLDPDGSSSGHYLTLRRLLCWLCDPLRRMRLLAAVGDAAEGLEGGALAGAVYEYSLHGDPFVAANAAKLLQQVCVPLYAIIRRWVLEGELDDPYNEFFVVQHQAAAAVSAALAAATAAAAGGGGIGGGPGGAPPALDLWRQSYGLDESRLPPFIGPSLAQRILRAGKAIHYLNLACGDGGWVQQRAEAWARCPPAAAAAAAASGSGELAGLEVLVSEAVRSVDERLLAVIWRRHRLRAHLGAIRRFLLLGQGDWVTAFIDLAQRELDKPAGDVSEVQLSSCLRQALTATNVL